MQASKDTINLLKLEHLGRELLKGAHFIKTNEKSYYRHKGFNAAALLVPSDMEHLLGVKGHYQLWAEMGSDLGGVRWELRTVKSSVDPGTKRVRARETLESVHIDSMSVKNVLVNNADQIVSSLVPTKTEQQKELLIKASAARKVNEYSGRDNHKVLGIEGVRGIILDRIDGSPTKASYEFGKVERIFPLSIEVVGGTVEFAAEGQPNTRISLDKWGEMWSGTERPLGVLFANAKELGVSEEVAGVCWEVMEKILTKSSVERINALVEESFLLQALGKGLEVAKSRDLVKVKVRV